MVPSVLQKWVSALSSEINEDCKIGRDLGHGFFQVVMKEEAAMQKVLMLMPHLSKWGTCIMQAGCSVCCQQISGYTHASVVNIEKCPRGIPE